MMELNGAPRDRREKALGDLQLLSDEVISSILSLLTPRDVARLACVSSVMYIFCSEEPLWMSLCLKNAGGPFQYKGSWKRTLLHLENVQTDNEESHPRLHFDGFYSMFLYKRMYRCCTRLDGFYVDDGNVERKEDMTLEAFQLQYDGKKPVLINGLSDTWPARKTWTVQGLLESYGETLFKISQRNARKLTMKFKDYVSYMETQHDEDPLYIFDDKFGETAPSLLKDYDVPHLFREDFFDVLEREQHPPFRWLIIGPERSGASWHVDPALTSAWNTLLCGRKRWALYPPGRVPVGVTVHVNEEDGDVNIETPTSLQWWLDYYPLLPDEEKPIECTQLPGETIFVPSGWWHCVLNLENTIAVTQNFVNSKNFEYVCLDMAPGYRHKGICRAGFVALEEDSLDDMENPLCYDDDDDCFGSKKMPRKGKQKGLHKCSDADDTEPPESILRWNNAFPYEINFLSKFLDDDRDHYNSIWCSGNCIGQREMRDWLWKLWKAKPEMRDLIWKGACLALNAGKWLECVREICQFHSLPAPTEDDKLPIGTGSNPVYLIAGNVIKIYVEGGLESSLFGLGTELQFYNLVSEVECTLEDHIPDILTSGIIFRENGSHKIVPWDGKVLPDLLPNCSYVAQMDLKSSHFGVWSKKLYEYNTAKTQGYKSACLADSTQIWPYIITERCSGKIFAELRESLSWEDALNLASFLGEQLRNIHLLHLPPLTDLTRSSILPELESSLSVKATDVGVCESESESAIEWMLFVKILETRKKDVINRLTNWGNPIPVNLIEKVNEYLPEDFEQFLHIIKSKTCSWIHSDVMDDNIFMECLTESASDSCQRDRVLVNGSTVNGGGLSWKPSYIIDFSNLTIGDPLLDIIPIHLDVFRGDLRLLKQFLSSYKLPLWKKRMEDELAEEKSMRISYLTMCYCILHDDNVLGAIFSLWEELRNANSWEEVEEKVWGDLNGYASFA